MDIEDDKTAVDDGTCNCNPPNNKEQDKQETSRNNINIYDTSPIIGLLAFLLAVGINVLLTYILIYFFE